MNSLEYRSPDGRHGGPKNSHSSMWRGPAPDGQSRHMWRVPALVALRSPRVRSSRTPFNLMMQRMLMHTKPAQWGSMVILFWYKIKWLLLNNPCPMHHFTLISAPLFCFLGKQIMALSTTSWAALSVMPSYCLPSTKFIIGLTQIFT